MRYLPLIWSGLWRRPVRTTLTLLAVAAAFVVFGLLHGVTATFDEVIDQLSDTRLRTTSRIGMLEPLPLGHLAQIERVTGVADVSYYTLFIGHYQSPDNTVAGGAVNMERFLRAFPEYMVPDEQREVLLRMRTGALVGKDLAEQHGWNVGDRVPVQSMLWTRQDGSADWTFDVMGIYDLDGMPASELYFHYEYLDEGRANARGTVNMYFPLIEDPEAADSISAAIDELFVNSADPTETKSEKEWMRAQLDQIGNIEYVVHAIIAAVLFTLLFLTANTMMQSVRERIPEFAVLKTCGYTDGTVAVLVSAETLVLCGTAAAAGLLVAHGVFPSLFVAIGAPGLPLPLSVAAAGMGMAALLAVVSAAGPVWRVHRISIVDALAGR